MAVYLALDVGGSTIKAALVEEDGTLVTQPIRFPSCSGGSRAEILGQLALTICTLARQAREMGQNPAGIGFGFPGPFDYEAGVSRIQGLGKFDSIYGCALPTALETVLPEPLPMRFANDADLYTLGEANFGVGRPYRKVFCICIGTGIGSGFCRDGQLVKSGDTVPENGWIYQTPYGDSIADAYASATGLRRMIRQDPALGQIPDVKELAEAATAGNTPALALFQSFGEILRDIVLPHALRFGADCLVVGGDVAKSGALFLTPLEDALGKAGIALQVSRAFSQLTLQAIPLLFVRKEG